MDFFSENYDSRKVLIESQLWCLKLNEQNDGNSEWNFDMNKIKKI